MKMFKKIVSVAMCIVMILGMANVSFAESAELKKITRSEKSIVNEYMDKIAEMEKENYDFANTIDDEWTNAEIIEQGIEEIVFFNNRGDVSERYVGSEAIEIVEEILKESTLDYNSSFDSKTEITQKSKDSGNIFYINTYKIKERNDELIKSLLLLKMKLITG